ncbi:hypothetical protein MMC25_005037 [Agyrium rufum]|nr:hypothetical protein [Agyrium rufum]
MDKDMMDSFRWLEDDDLDLRLDDYHLQLADAVNQPAKPPSRRPSFRRTLSLTNMPFAKDLRSSNDSCTKQPPSTTSAQFPSLQPHSSHHKRNFSFSNPLTKTPIFNPPDGLSTVDASAAKHYQDPEARLKLRVYLASPQKFDEALEFGFPSLDASQGPTRPLSRRPSVSNVKPIQAYSLGGGDFFDDKDDLTSFFKDPEDDDDDDDEDDTATLPDPDSPNTPSDLTMTRPSAHRFQTSVPRSSQSTSSTRPPMWHSTTDPSSSYGWAGNREMTLRMTLTRPDLRADESILYPKDDRDPLALEDLPLEGGDIWSNLKGKEGKEGGRLGRLWKRVSRKSSAN